MRRGNTGDGNAVCGGNHPQADPEKGCRFRDFAVVAGSLDDYGKEALRAFSGSGIPCFIDEKKPALANPFVEWIRAAVDMAVQSYSYESVFRYLRCGFSGFSQEDTDRMENYVVALGIHGRKQYEERWVRNYRGQKPEETEELNRLRSGSWKKPRDLPPVCGRDIPLPQERAGCSII